MDKSQSGYRPQIVIWGPDNYNTLGMIRSLKNPEFDVLLLVVGRLHSVASASKYCKRIHVSKSVEESVLYLIDNYPQTNNPLSKAVLMPGGDTYSIAGARNYDSLSARFHLMCTSNPDILLRVTDKSEMGKIAAQAGILAPKSCKITKDNLSHDIPYPIILKHIHSEGRVEFKTKIISSQEELVSFSKYLNPRNTYLAQQFVPRTHDIYVYGCRLNSGKVVLAGYNNQYRWSDDGGGSFGDLNPDIPSYIDTEALNRFLEAVDYHGLFSSEYGFYNGKAYFYEVNFRNDGFTHLALQAGANLPLLWVSDCLNMEFSDSAVMTRSMISMNEVYDFVNVLKGNITYRQYKNDKASAEAFNFYDPEDPQPYLNLRHRMWWEIPGRLVYKKFRTQIIWLLSKFNY